MNSPTKIGVCFVCYANICRSPLAEGTLRHLAERRGVLDRLHIDSAGTNAMVDGAPHTLSQRIAEDNGFSLAGRSRQLVRDDLVRFDHVIVMDRRNLATIEGWTGSAFGGLANFKANVRLLRALTNPRARGRDLDVPDPISGGPDHYLRVYEMVHAGCEALLDELR